MSLFPIYMLMPKGPMCLYLEAGSAWKGVWLNDIISVGPYSNRAGALIR